MSLSKERMREYMRERRQQRRDRGLCPMCGTERDDLKFVNCSACRAKATSQARKYRESRDLIN